MSQPDTSQYFPRGYESFQGRVQPRSSQSEPWWPSPRRAPEKAPNVIVMLVDDMGFSDVSPFGGEIDTPAVASLAEEGYLLSNFHSAPLCAPTRAALLTGVNPHRTGFGFVPHIDPGFPGYSMELPESMPTLAESFRDNGYATLMVGKWHLTHEAKMTEGSDQSSWPTQRGFDRYYGVLEGMTSLYHPHRVVRDNSVVTEQFAADDYFTDRLTSEAIGMIDTLRANYADKPFFLYYAHMAVHGPVQSKPLDIQKYAGRYNAGWDQIRQERFARQQEQGIFDSAAVLSPSTPENTQGVSAWDTLTPEQQALYARHMEVYAAAVDGVDQSMAQLIAHLKEIGEYENTIIVFTSDNGGSGEGGLNGTRSYLSQFGPAYALPADWQPDVPRPLEDIGGPQVFGHYPTGWAHASNTPFRLYKGSVYEGGVHTPLILSWPSGLPKLEDDNGIRHNFAYITDIAPTLLELAGVERPQQLGGLETDSEDGQSFVTTLHDATSAQVRQEQYLSSVSQRAMYLGTYKAVAPQLAEDLNDPAGWQLYNLAVDPAETVNIAADHPEPLAEMIRRWDEAAWHNTVYPVIDDRATLTRRPSTVLEFSEPVTIRPGVGTLERWRSRRLVSLRSFVVEVRLDGTVGQGVLFSHGDQGGGYVLYCEDGQITLAYNAYGAMHRVREGIGNRASLITVNFQALPDFAWAITVTVDGAELVRLDRVPMLVGLAPFTGISVGFDGGGPVDWELYQRHGVFAHTGSLISVRYIPGEVADYNPETVVAIADRSAQLLD